MKRKITKEQVLAGTMAVVMPFVPVAAAAAVLTGCPTETKHEPKKCECTDEQKAEHYLPCNCKVEASNVCDCEQTPRGYIPEYMTSIQVPIYQTTGVENGKAVTATENIVNGYIKIVDSYKNDFAGKIKEVWVITGENSFEVDSETGKVIFKFNCDVTQNGAKNYFLDTHDDYPELFAGIVKALPPVHDKGWQRYNRTKMQYDNRIASTKIRPQRLG